MRAAGFEPTTSCSGGKRSIQLSYARRLAGTSAATPSHEHHNEPCSLSRHGCSQATRTLSPPVRIDAPASGDTTPPLPPIRHYDDCVLVGGGPSRHLHVAASRAPADSAPIATWRSYEAGDRFYSGMVPRLPRQGQCEADGRCAFDLGAARPAGRGARWCRPSPTRVDVAAREVETGRPARCLRRLLPRHRQRCRHGTDVPGVADHALTLRRCPAPRCLRDRLRVAHGRAARPRHRVVGARRGGVEAAFARASVSPTPAPRGTVSLVDSATDVLPDFAPDMRTLTRDVLRERGIALVLGGTRRDGVTRRSVTLHNGATLRRRPGDSARRGPPRRRLARSGLAHADGGYPLVAPDATAPRDGDRRGARRLRHHARLRPPSPGRRVRRASGADARPHLPGRTN